VRLSVRMMLALVAVLTVPFAFWGWRLRAGVPFPAGLDLATIAVTVVSAGVIADILIEASRDRPRLLGSFAGKDRVISSTNNSVWPQGRKDDCR
jgi:hypothetical protein